MVDISLEFLLEYRLKIELAKQIYRQLIYNMRPFV